MDFCLCLQIKTWHTILGFHGLLPLRPIRSYSTDLQLRILGMMSDSKRPLISSIIQNTQYHGSVRDKRKSYSFPSTHHFYLLCFKGLSHESVLTILEANVKTFKISPKLQQIKIKVQI